MTDNSSSQTNYKIYEIIFYSKDRNDRVEEPEVCVRVINIFNLEYSAMKFNFEKFRCLNHDLEHDYDFTFVKTDNVH